MSVVAAWLLSVLPVLAERVVSLWPFLLPLGALILAVAGLSLAQEASYYRALDGYRERVGAVVGHAWTVHGAERAHSLLEDLPTFPETAVQRRRRRRAERPPKDWLDYEVVALLRDPSFDQHTSLTFVKAPSAVEGLHSVADRLGLWSSSDTEGRSEPQIRVAGRQAFAAGSTYLIAVRPASKPIRLWLLRRWS